LPVLVSIGEGLKDAKEECFAILICDGIPVAIAYARAGFDQTNSSGLELFRSARIQARCRAIFEARAKTPGLGLPDITDMLKRVYANALHGEEYSAAHNAAFSLARLYGLVVDRAQLDVIRRPSREPDAPSEQALGSWIEALPTAQIGPASSALSEPLGSGPEPHQGQIVSRETPGPGPVIEGSIYGSDLDGPRSHEGEGEIGNGAPSRPVTGTPSPGEHSEPLGSEYEGTGIFPRAEDLF
jgi:hypothetical protein